MATILVEQSSHKLHNMGDVAMLVACCERVRACRPGTRLRVATVAPAQLARFVPGAEPVDPIGYLRPPRMLPVPDRWPGVGRAERFAWGMYPRLSEAVTRTAPVRWWSGYQPDRDPGRLTAGCDLALSSGGGFVNDDFGGHASVVLRVLRAAQRNGKPTAMFGQGLGPLTDRALGRSAEAVFRRLRLLTLREGLRGPKLAMALGAPADRVVVTGDDAVEAAYNQRADRLGTRLGVNVRRGDYAGVNRERATGLISHLRSLAQELGCPLVSVPILYGRDGAGDQSSVEPFAADDPGVVLYRGPDTPADVARHIGTCRVVVTGSYHAGVFSLSQGVPVVGLCGSQYYADKFAGLADQFGLGCRMVNMMGASAADELSAVTRHLWASAPDLREPLLDAARRQIRTASDAYAAFFSGL